jgi:O-antigen ligase
MMFLLSSKLSLALVLVLILFMAFYIGYRNKILFRTFILLAFTIILSAVLARNLDYLNWRISGLKFKEYTGPDDNQNGFALRLTTWQSAIELISEKPILGYGLKGANDALVEKYEEKNFTMGIPERYNSHNQFLETTLKSGIIGLVLLLLLIGVPLVSSIRKQQFLLTIMILHFVLVSMVEGTMEIQQELIFYWFFIFLFYYHYPTVNKKTILPEK